MESVSCSVENVKIFAVLNQGEPQSSAKVNVNHVDDFKINVTKRL